MGVPEDAVDEQGACDGEHVLVGFVPEDAIGGQGEPEEGESGEGDEVIFSLPRVSKAQHTKSANWSATGGHGWTGG